MKNSLLFTLLDTFSKKEHARFSHFLCEPGRSIRPEAKLLYQLFQDEPGTAPETIHLKLYPNKPFSLKQVNQVGSWLYANARFFLLREIREREDNQTPLIREFEQRKLPRHQERLIRQLRKLEKSSAKAYELEYTIYATTHRKSRTETNNLQAIDDHLDQDYLQRKLRQACLMHSHENVYQVAYNKGLLLPALAYVEDQKLQQNPIIGAYYHIYQCLGNPEALERFTAFKQILSNLPHILDTNERRDLYLLGINFCIRRLNAGYPQMASEALLLYKEGLNNSALLDDGRLTPFTYRNAVALSLKVQDFTWAEDFIDRYAQFLPAAIREETVAYNRARLAAAAGEPQKALEALRYVKSKDVLFTLTIETLRAKIYYEINASELLFAHLEKMYIYLRRKGDSYHYQSISKFISYLKKILSSPPSRAEVKKLKETIQDEPVLHEKRWLLQQLSALSANGG